MNIQKMIPAFAIAIGLALAMATSGFKEGPKDVNPYFYEYVGLNFTQTSIEDPDNYIRGTSSCTGGQNVCGVFLNTDQGSGNPADPTDFSSESSNLWLSQQSQSAVNGNIKMKN